MPGKRNVTAALVPLILLAGLVGCSALPDRQAVRYDATYDQAMPSVDRVGLLVDGLVAYDQLGTSKYVDLRDSVSAIDILKLQAETAIRDKGYQIASLDSPLVGGFKHIGAEFPVADAPGTEPHSMTVPLRTPGYWAADPMTRDLFQKVSYLTMTAFESAGAPPTSVVRADATGPIAMTMLGRKLHIRYLVVVQGYGVIESGGMKALSLAITNTHLDAYASIVDLQTATVIWSNSHHFARLNPSNASDYESNHWARELLYWLPPRGRSQI